MDNPTRTTEELHAELVESLRKKHLLDNPSVESAFVAVPRHLFLPGISPEQAYADIAIPIKANNAGEVISSSSQPTMMALMFKQLELQAGMNILEIGTATGYNASLMKHIVGNTGYVTSLELDHDIAEQARTNLSRAGYSNVNVVTTDAVTGYAPRAMYDRVISTVGVWDVPHQWLDQLKNGGRLVTPIWLDGVQVSATFLPQADGTFLSTDNRPCAFVYLRGVGEGPQVRKQIGSTSMIILADEVDKIDTVSLHLLLSDDLEIHTLGTHLDVETYWYGFQIYLMLNEPEKFIFAVYGINEGQKAYGMEGRGIALFAPASAAFAGYNDGGAVYSFAGSDAYMEMQKQLDRWIQQGRPNSRNLCLRLIPIEAGKPEITKGKIYTRREHYLHVWLD